jgi:hypothetical protein
MARPLSAPLASSMSRRDFGIVSGHRPGGVGGAAPRGVPLSRSIRYRTLSHAWAFHPIKGEKTLVELAQQCNVHPNQITAWKAGCSGSVETALNSFLPANSCNASASADRLTGATETLVALKHPSRFQQPHRWPLVRLSTSMQPPPWETYAQTESHWRM